MPILQADLGSQSLVRAYVGVEAPRTLLLTNQPGSNRHLQHSVHASITPLRMASQSQTIFSLLQAPRLTQLGPNLYTVCHGDKTAERRRLLDVSTSAQKM